MKIAIIGSTGLLGSNLFELYKEHDVKSFSRTVNKSSSNNFVLDFSKIETELARYFNDWCPDIIINCIALVNLQECENNISFARETNCGIANSLAKVSKEFNSYYIHISTDHYFNDDKKIHSETDKVKILNNYALTKFEAEKEVLKSNSNSLVVRTNIIGFRRNDIDSFFEWLLNSLIDKNSISLYTNFYTSPICVKLLGEILLKCYNKKIKGIYNIASSEVISKYDFGLRTAQKFDFSFESVKKSLIENKKSSLNRALTLGLDISKIEKDLGISMPTIDDTLNSLHSEFLKGR